jgi:hypothetical protein
VPDSQSQRLRRPQFFLRTLVLLVALAALALFAEVTRRRSKPAARVWPPGGASRIARLKHAGDWNVAPQAIPNLMGLLRQPTLGFNAVLSPQDLFPRDPNLIYCPLISLTGRGAFSFTGEDLDVLRRHLDPGGGILFADAACGSPAFDAAFRRFAAELFPNHTLEPIPRDDELYTDVFGFDLSRCHYTKAAGGIQDYPLLEGVRLNGQWAIIYSKYGVSCVLDRDHDGGCKGYKRNDAVKIWANVLIGSALP